MRIIVMSDSHGDPKLVRQIVEGHLADAELFVHLGDGVQEFCSIMMQYPEKRFTYVVGNHEDEQIRWNHRENELIEAEGHRILLTHGDKLQVKLDLLLLLHIGKRYGADVILFGHTHRALDGEKDGVRLINPGALRYPRDAAPSYAILDLDPTGVKTQLVIP